ncbi:MAG: 2-oxo acid dehydrogenase subunit E2 [Halioglobus sp.]|nr:2-oxo acid dehydrogenase subunit E2 [Halioglobus sp.]
MNDIYPIAVPKWGIEMMEGTITTWNKQLGDQVVKGDEVFEMESDKIVNVWDSPVDGLLRRILAQEGDTHPVGSLLGVIAAADIGDSAIDDFIANFSGAAAEEPPPSEKPLASPRTGASDAVTRSSPSVRKLAAELGIDLNTVTGTGRRGRITEDDVRAATNTDADTDSKDFDVVPLSATRKTIGKRLTGAKQEIPHFYLTAKYELDGLLARREELNTKGDKKVSVNDLVVWCIAQALVKEPRINVNLVGDNIYQFKDANISIAIATDDGLYPATVRKAQNKSPAELAAIIAELAAKAKAGNLTKEDISGGSFTVSNLGMFGISNFTAIINPPMGAILALGKAEQKVVVREGQPSVAIVVEATLSCDHRVIDGAVGAKFLQVLGEEFAAL